MSLPLVTSYEEGEKGSPHCAQVQRRRGGTVTGETPNSETLNFGVHAVASLIPVHQNSVSVADARGQMKTADAPGLLPSSWDFQPSRLSASPTCTVSGRWTRETGPTKNVAMDQEAGDKLNNRSGRGMRKSGKYRAERPR